MRGWIAVASTCLCLLLLVRGTELPILVEAGRQASYRLMLVALVVTTVSLFCKATRWWALYPRNARPQFQLAVVGLVLGQIVNWAIPARFGDLVRVGLVTSGSPSVAVTEEAALGLGILAVEKTLDAVMLVVAAAVLAVLGVFPRWLNDLTLAFGCASVILIVGVILLRRGGETIRGLTRRWDGTRLGSVVRTLPVVRSLASYGASAARGFSVLSDAPTATVAFGLSVTAWVLGGLTNYVVMQSVGLGTGAGPALAILVALYGGAIIPSLPGRVAVFQYLCVLALEPFGVDFDHALVYSFALYVAVYLPPLVLGLLSAIVLGKASLRPFARLLAQARPRPAVLDEPH